jgi:hypothetical protein
MMSYLSRFIVLGMLIGCGWSGSATAAEQKLEISRLAISANGRPVEIAQRSQGFTKRTVTFVNNTSATLLAEVDFTNADGSKGKYLGGCLKQVKPGQFFGCKLSNRKITEPITVTVRLRGAPDTSFTVTVTVPAHERPAED